MIEENNCIKICNLNYEINLGGISKEQKKFCLILQLFMEAQNSLSAGAQTNSLSLRSDSFQIFLCLF